MHTDWGGLEDDDGEGLLSTGGGERVLLLLVILVVVVYLLRVGFLLIGVGAWGEEVNYTQVHIYVNLHETSE